MAIVGGLEFAREKICIARLCRVRPAVRCGTNPYHQFKSRSMVKGINVCVRNFRYIRSYVMYLLTYIYVVPTLSRAAWTCCLLPFIN